VPICDDLADWDQIGCTSAGFDAMSAFGKDLLEAWGFEDVGWSDEQPFADDVGESFLAAYDSSTQTIHLDPDFLCGSDGIDVANIVAHEVIHAAMDQAGWALDTASEELLAAGEGQNIAIELDGECVSTESGSVGEMPDFPWGMSTATVPDR
jgi:hypothetical protein